VLVERTPAERERSAAGTVTPAGAEPDGYSILIIEDNPDVVEYLESCWGDPRGHPNVPDPESKSDPRGRPNVPDPESKSDPNPPTSNNSHGDEIGDYPKLGDFEGRLALGQARTGQEYPDQARMGDHKGREYPDQARMGDHKGQEYPDQARMGDHKGRPDYLYFAYNGQAGIEKALETIPDLIISDVMMPIKDGFEVVETLKNDERTSHIPIILLTAKADVQSRLAGLRRGADAYLSKPFHREELLVTVENLLETRKKLQLKYQQTIFTTEVPATPITPLAKENPDVEDVFLQNIRLIIEENYTQEDFGLPQLCLKAGMSRSQLFRKMKALTDLAPSDLIRSHRLNRAKTLLESGSVNVAEAAWRVGFKDPSYFSKLYQEEFGVAPSAVKR
jgi:CheY-like chemotaxis protein/AraC-like DNA-binding protein